VYKFGKRRRGTTQFWISKFKGVLIITVGLNKTVEVWLSILHTVILHDFSNMIISSIFAYIK
jgi:hypothetical protein